MGTLAERKAVIQQVFRTRRPTAGYLNAHQLQVLHAEIRQGGINLQQVEASIQYVCAGDGCEEDELYDVLQEMDRRYYLLQDLKWEFSLLDHGHSDSVTPDQARFMFEAAHGQLFSKRKWQKFLQSRHLPESGVSFSEIEVDLCNIPNREEVLREKLEEEQHSQEKFRRREEQRSAQKRRDEEERKKREAEELRKRTEEENRKKEEERNLKQKEEEKIKEKKRLEEEKEREEKERKRLEAEKEKQRLEEQRRLEEEEGRRQAELIEVKRAQEIQLKLEAEAKARQEQRSKELEEAKDAEVAAKEAEEAENQAKREAEEAMEAAKKAKTAEEKEAAEKARKKAEEKAKAERESRIRNNLKVAVKSKEKKKLESAIQEFKKAKLKDTDGDLAAAERLIKMHQAKGALVDAMKKRKLADLEKAVTAVKKGGFEVDMPEEMIQANKLMVRLKRLERLRQEVQNLKQSTVAEIRSYSKPPAAVHQVMIATYLLLGNPEKETKNWKLVQALVGKTGKDGLKRRVLECDPMKVPPAAAARAKEILDQFDLDSVRDVSGGAATFYVWAVGVIEEVEEEKERSQDQD
ncbi:PREDICTED: trichohyalin-like [Branchiostoma belcheri]|uniref:Trichohyalin-like n=1 Tax=Branchiostoma belcheri TaxID=7741 RepID=A0A6P4ZVI4_BRABE|nr:PREDICTED: trichohyalin-like [Branchiostoma belcheri]XP_019638019.1 PREDICTED: trichohyalin-like [Branchiostoma belcheri]